MAIFCHITSLNITSHITNIKFENLRFSSNKWRFREKVESRTFPRSKVEILLSKILQMAGVAQMPFRIQCSFQKIISFKPPTMHYRSWYKCLGFDLTTRGLLLCLSSYTVSERKDNISKSVLLTSTNGWRLSCRVNKLKERVRSTSSNTPEYQR